MRERRRQDRREHARREELAQHAPDPAGDLEPARFEAVTHEALLRGIERLPSGDREVLVLHDVEGNTHDTVAAMLGISAGTSKSQLSRARRTLRALLAGMTGGPVRMRPGEEPR